MHSGDLPKLGMLHYREYPRAVDLKGTDKHGKIAPGLTLVDFEEAMTQRWETDCHVVGYRISGLGQEVYPTIQKTLLPALLEVGAKVETTTLFLDLDTPDHSPLTPDYYQAFQKSLLNAYESGFSPALDWTAYYSTRAGIRLVYVLSQPIGVELAEGLHKGLVRDFWSVGVKVDTGCSDWCHVFRLPNVIRDGKPLWESPFAEIILQLEKRLDVESIKPLFESLGSFSTSPAAQFDEPKPTPEETEAALFTENPQTGRRIMSDWHKKAKTRLKNRECFDSIWNQAPIAHVGARNSTLQRYVGQACSLLLPLADTTPLHIYALFYEAVLGLEPDSGDPDWTNTLWRQVGYCWSHEKAKLEQELACTEPDKELLDQMLDGMKGWCDAPELSLEQAEAREWMQSHLIADNGIGLHVMRRDGRYDSLSVNIRQLAARIRELNVEEAIPLWMPTADGTGVRPRQPQSILNAHATAISLVEGRVGEFGGIIRDIGTERARLIVSLYKRRDDLEPRFDDSVDTWLKLLGGKDYPKLCTWIGQALAFEDGPICALSISGAPGIGKKLFVQGLAECVNTETVCALENVANFHTFLMYTPFVVVNEGIQDTRWTSRDIADTFRHFTSGDPIEVNQKYKPPIFVRSPLRLIFTANNVDTLSVLTAHRDLSPEDREALAIRLFHIETSNDAAIWLQSQGGLKFTQGWIYGDSGSPSRYVIARHFLWLYEHRDPLTRGQRLLVEGELSKSIEKMTTSSGAAPAVIETLIKMIELPSVQNEGLVVGQGTIWVTSSAIVEQFRNDIGAKTGREINHRQVSRVLRGLIVRPHPEPIKIKLKTGKEKRARWHEIDAIRLMGEAIEHGYPHTNLQKVLDYQELEWTDRNEQDQGAHSLTDTSRDI